MPKYRKKPIVVDAEVYREGLEDYFKYHIPMFGLFTKEECIASGFTPDFEKDKIPLIKTLEGEHMVSDGDYIITDFEGERYPCKPNMFEKGYEVGMEKGFDIVCNNCSNLNSIINLERNEIMFLMTTGQMIDKLKIGMVVENQFGDKLTYSDGKLRWDNGELFYINIDQIVLSKWKIIN